MSSCVFCVEDHCLYREMMKHATEDCPFMGEGKLCTATEEDLMDYTKEEEEE